MRRQDYGLPKSFFLAGNQFSRKWQKCWSRSNLMETTSSLLMLANVQQKIISKSWFNQSMWQREFENHQEFISFSEARFDKSVQWTIRADVWLLLLCFRLGLKADFDKLSPQFGAGSLFRAWWIYRNCMKRWKHGMVAWSWPLKAIHVRKISAI